ncbi:MAG TPA: hypothetical protein VD816_13270 [Ohtaekwangia sp.]|nr:hypothetical protein [Ohtaekwangia sp.]
MPVNDEDTYPIDTVVRFKKTGLFAVIKQKTFLKDGRGFLNYLGVIEGRDPDEQYAIYHEDVELEALPPESNQP